MIRSEQSVLAEHFLDGADGLAGARLVLDQREAHMTVTVVAEAGAWRYRDLAPSRTAKRSA